MSATLHLFPLDKRIGKIRSTAEKMLAKTTERHAAFYREQVTAALSAQLEKNGADEIECRMQLSAFWRRVQAEMMARTFQGTQPGGAA
jgi:hypothetical protein